MNPSIEDLREQIFSKLGEIFEPVKEQKSELEPEIELTPEQIELIKKFHQNFRIKSVLFYSSSGIASPSFRPRAKPLEEVQLVKNEHNDLQTNDNSLVIADKDFWFDAKGDVKIYDIESVEGTFCLDAK